MRIRNTLGHSLGIITFLLALAIEFLLPRGASSYHSGIDIPAPAGTNIYAIYAGEIIFVGFYGADGYTIILQNKNMQFLYAHVSPRFIVQKRQKIFQGELIGEIGPMYVDSPENTKYFDSTGKKTNGALTGPHLHLTIKKDGIAVNPLDYLSSSH